MNVIRYVKENGLKHIWNVLYQYKIDLIIQTLMKPFFKNKSLQDIIMIESHNDFDSNGGAFYDYLIKHGYNKKYRIIWLLKNPDKRPNNLPENVDWVSLLKPSVKKNYYYWIAKYFTADNNAHDKLRNDQMSIYLTHGAGGFKSIVGKINIPQSVDYVLIQSENYAPIQAEQYSLKYPSKRLVYIGYPSHDLMHNSDGTEILKITHKKYKKIVIWMPTFRKGICNRNDSSAEQLLGIPLLKSQKEYEQLNKFLNELDMLLIIKIHPMQELKNFSLCNMSNICVLTGEDVKKANIDNYRLLPCTDAMISDYSGVAYDYLQLNKPIAYVTEDQYDYKLGFVVEDIRTLMGGPEIKTLQNMLDFIKDIANDNDLYADKRVKLRDYIYKYHDNHCCERLAQLMRLKK